MNIWLSQVSLGNRKSCPTCKTKLSGDNCIVSVGEYSRNYFFKWFYACKECLIMRMHQYGCNRKDVLRYRSGQGRIAWVEKSKEEMGQCE